MKRRSSPRSACGQEEGERQVGDQKHGLRQRKCINYLDPDDIENVDHDDEEEREEEEDDCNQSLQNMLDKGKKCIECDSRWYTPPAFEDFAGKGSSKKWKSSICSDGLPLQHWFDQGLLVTEGYLKKGATNFKRKGQIIQNNGDESAYNLRKRNSCGEFITIEESEEDLTEDSEDEYVSSERRCKSLRMEEEMESLDDRNEDDSMNSDNSDGNQDDEVDLEKMEDDGDVHDDTKDLCAQKEPDLRLIISTPKRHAFQKKMTVSLKRISMPMFASQSTSVENPLEDEEKRECGSDIDICENEKESKTEELFNMSEQDSEEPEKMENLTTKTSPQRQHAKKEICESLKLCATPLSMPGLIKCDNHTDGSNADHIESQAMSETGNISFSDSTHISDIEETSRSEVFARYDVDTMDLDQLKRETLKMQLEASRVQKEYYTLKLHQLKSRMHQDTVNSSPH